MSKYLPDDSNMRAGLEIMNNEFGSLAEMGGSDVRVMCKGLTNEEKVDLMVTLRGLEDVNSVSEQENGKHTLYELGVSSAVDQVSLGEEISELNPKIKVVETSQDGATAEAPMLVGAVCLLLIILFAMCQSWLEPVLFLASTGIAVVLNVGTNALLPSVSVTTNSIVAILQLVLSMDYSIILINRFRQERLTAENSIQAMQNAVKKASSSIISSAFTTIVGLIMLVFMKLKIGTDLGVVLSKGVLCSLICNFTVLPSLILIAEKGIDKSLKRILTLPTDKFSNFSLRQRIPLTILFVALFVGSFIWHNQTNIKFLNAQASKIEKYFPKKNPVVLIYDNADEAKVVSLMDSLMADSSVEMVLSYPSLLLREYTAPQMVEAISDLSGIMAGMGGDATNEMPAFSMDMLSDDVLKVVYYAANHGNEDLTMNFNEMADFIIQQSLDPNSLIAKQMDDNFKKKLNMLNDLRSLSNFASTDVHKAKEEPKQQETSIPEKVPEIELSPAPIESPVKTEVTNDAHTPSVYSPYADTTLIRKAMNSNEMASFLGMDSGQAKTVYKLAKRSGSTMTPVQFVHFVTEDILQRKMLAAMIKESQKKQLLAVQNTMDSALVALPIVINETPVTTTTATTSNNTTPTIKENQPAQKEIVTPKVQKIKLSANDPIVVLDEMLNGSKEYTAKEMSKNLSLIGEEIPEPLIDLLYLYYGGNKEYNDDWTMSLEQMVNFICDSVTKDPRFESFIDEDMRKGLGDLQHKMFDGVGKLRSKDHSIAMIITGFATEAPETYKFIDRFNNLCNENFKQPYYAIGESVMLSEMKAGFNHEILLVTMLTIAAIFLIVAITFRSALLSAILVMTVMTGVFINVVVNGFGGGSILYLAYLIVQSILMGAAIDYGILFANYYRENRETLAVDEALRKTYKNSIHTIMTSGLILILVPAIMTILVADQTVSDIVKSISIGAFATVTLILFVLPGVLATCDKIIVRKKKEK